jgi:hypothetical protein
VRCAIPPYACYSSFRRSVRLAAYPEDRAGDLSAEAHPFGER